MADKRLLELALKGLEAERQRVEQEMQEIKKTLGAATRKIAGQPTGRQKTAAEKRALSLRMKNVWAERKAAAKVKLGGRGKQAGKPASRRMSAAARKAQSQRMKEIWAKRRAEAAKK